MSVTAEEYQRPSETFRISASRKSQSKSDGLILGLMVRTGFRLGLSKRALNWHNAYTRINPWGQGGFVDRVLERLTFFE